LGEIRPTAGRYLHYKRKSTELWLVHILELHAEVYLKTGDFACSMPIYIFINELPR
jgi:hypothetical protein